MTIASVRAADELRRRTEDFRPRIGVILGSGLGGLADRFEGGYEIPFEEIPSFPRAGVAGHAGVVRIGHLGGVPCVALRGRAHLYEGHPAHHAALPVRVMARLGIEALFVSNAAGAVNRTFAPGDLMLITDHVNFMHRDPLAGEGTDEPLAPGPPAAPYDATLCEAVREASRATGVPIREGVYGANLGPSFETPAEIRMVERLGVDAVGMSTVPEVLTARAMAVRCFGVSCMTNYAAGIATQPLTHEEVIETTERVKEEFQGLVLAALARAADVLSDPPSD